MCIRDSNKLIKSLTQNAQFILITHNKKTMEIGDILYGVTMENPGISKTVSVEFQEAERLIAWVTNLPNSFFRYHILLKISQLDKTK